MGLLQRAVETYDNMAHLAGKPRAEHATLVPISHITQKAQIEVTLDRDGNFIGAKEVPKDDCRTIIPASEASAGRTSGVAAHPFSDQLEYLLPDNVEKHTSYLTELDAWANSAFTHAKVRAVQTLIHSETLKKDLADTGLIMLNADGTLGTGKIAGTEYAKCMVRWHIPNTGDHDDAWSDQSLHNAYIDYYTDKTANGTHGLCMISGSEAFVTPNHPKGITSSNYGAKLISANDAVGFTYRGRFTEPWQASTVSYLASQKAHNALQWIAADQGYQAVVGGRTFLCWNPKGLQTHQVTRALRIGTAEKPLRPTEYRNELMKTLGGLRDALPDRENVIICAFDAATTGRLSLTYYNELLASDFHDRIRDWYSTCCWENGSYGVQSPALYRIVELAFGTERENGKVEVDDRVRCEQMQRLVSCIYDRARLPYDIVQVLARKASNLQVYENKNRAALLFTACALIRKYWNDKLGKEEWSMAFEPDKKDRSYQYGCLLAVMEKAERDTYATDEGREPNAIRMQAAFCDRPLHTAYLLNRKLEPYFSHLKPASRAFYKRRISEIMTNLSEFPESEQNKPLKETYLMGYYLQRAELYKSHTKEQPEEEV